MIKTVPVVVAMSENIISLFGDRELRCLFRCDFSPTGTAELGYADAHPREPFIAYRMRKIGPRPARQGRQVVCTSAFLDISLPAPLS
jgi:hypothetical protein